MVAGFAASRVLFVPIVQVAREYGPLARQGQWREV